METKKSLKKSPNYSCNICDYNTCKKSDYDKHIVTRKHNGMVTMETKETKKSPKVAQHNMCYKCNKKYNTRSGLWKHDKKCNVNKNVILNDTEIEVNHGNTDKETSQVVTKDMFMELISDNKEMIKIIKEQQEQIKCMIPKIGNTINNTTNNNNFNLNVFLNEQCKDAININEFIKSLKITLDDLYFTRKNGITQGLSNLMINGLKELDVYKRPIHCTDFKRDIVYIKEHDKWEKDNNNAIMKKTIERVANRQRNKISDWVELHPNWIEDEKLQYEYLTILNKITEPFEDDDKMEKKIIKNIAREVQLTDIKK